MKRNFTSVKEEMTSAYTVLSSIAKIEFKYDQRIPKTIIVSFLFAAFITPIMWLLTPSMLGFFKWFIVAMVALPIIGFVFAQYITRFDFTESYQALSEGMLIELKKFPCLKKAVVEYDATVTYKQLFNMIDGLLKTEQDKTEKTVQVKLLNTDFVN